MRQIEVYRTEYKISDFITWGKQKLLDLSPNFQRRPVWSAGAKSFLIDTIVRGYPIPIIFLRDKKVDIEDLSNKREVVDGQQRIRTLFSYINPSLLVDFNPEKDSFTVEEQHNKELAKKTFLELAPEIGQKILNYQFSVHSLPADTDDREVIQIFRRMNSTGYRLNGQELRNSQYFGKFKVVMYELAEEQLNRWRGWKVFSESAIARMQEVEITSEFAQLMLSGVVGKSQKSLDSLYDKNNKEFPEAKEISKRFREVMNTIDENIGNTIANLPYIKKALFYSFFAHIYDVQFGIDSKLTSLRAGALSEEELENILKKGDRLKNEEIPEEVKNAISRRTTHPSSRKAVIKFLKS